MKLITQAFIFLLLINVTFATYAGRTIISNYSFDNGEYFKETGKAYYTTVEYPQDESDWYYDIFCWGSIGFDGYYDGAVWHNNKTTDWILLDQQPTNAYDILSSSNLPYSSFSGRESQPYILAYIMDTQLTYNRVDDLCGNNDYLLVTFWGGRSYLYYQNTNISVIETTTPYAGLMSVRDSMSIADKDKLYMCLNLTNATGSMFYSANTLFGINQTQNVTTTSLYTSITCEGLSTDYVHILPPTIKEYLLNTYRYQYLAPLTPLPNILSADPVPHSFVLYLNLKGYDWTNLIANGIFGAMKMAYNYIQKDLPPQIGQIVKAVNDIINVIIALIALYIIKEVFRYYLAFRNAIKTSIGKASVIIGQFFFFYIILILMFYALVHVPTLCTCKFIVATTTLNVMGFHIEAPKGILDFGAVAWDVAYLGVVSGSMMDCTSFLNNKEGYQSVMSLNTPFCESLPQTGMSIPELLNTTGTTCVPMIIKITVVIILLFLILITLALLWELMKYVFRRTKSLEEKVRGRDEPDYEDEEEL